MNTTKQAKTYLHSRKQVASRASQRTYERVLDYYLSLGYPASIARQYAADCVAVEQGSFRSKWS